MSRRGYIVMMIGLATFAAAGIVLYVWANPGYEAIEFDKRDWSMADAETRGRMVRDMLARHELIGMN